MQFEINCENEAWRSVSTDVHCAVVGVAVLAIAHKGATEFVDTVLGGGFGHHRVCAAVQKVCFAAQKSLTRLL